MKELKLKVEPVPSSAWGNSLAQKLPKKYWDVIRKLCYQRYLWKCQCCEVFNVKVHCHEVWTYDRRRRLKILMDLMCLCEDCHAIKHWGRTVGEFHKGKISAEEIERLKVHFYTVNKCIEADMLAHLVEVGDLNQKRSRFGYKLDLGNLEGIIKEFRKCIASRLK